VRLSFQALALALALVLVLLLFEVVFVERFAFWAAVSLTLSVVDRSA
jgi:hypothetical protein